MEATDLAGGLLRIAIPENRLPQEILDYDIEGIIETGVTIKTNQKAGVDFTIPDLLKDKFEAVFIASGGWDNRIARGDIDEVVNVFPGGSLLIDLFRIDIENSDQLPYGKNVIIAGGGGMIPEAVTILKEYGVENISVISRKTIENSSFDNETIKKLESLGASIVYNAGIKKLFGQEDTLTHIEYTELDTGIRHTIDADSLIIGSGRFPELCFINSDRSSKGEGDEADQDQDKTLLPLQWEGVEIYKEPSDMREQGLLSSKDSISGYSAAITAINGGRKASVLIHHLMYDIPFELPLNIITKQSVIQQVNQLEEVNIQARNIMPVAEEKIGSIVEHYSGFSNEAALKESERCLRCGILCYERSE